MIETTTLSKLEVSESYRSPDKLRVVLAGLFYPFAILTYFWRALERRNDIDLFTVGAWTNNWIPWNGGMTLPMKYVKSVDLPLPQNVLTPPWSLVKNRLPWKRPDLVITVDAGWHFADRPDAGCVAHVATDPHVLNYDFQRTISDKFFNMQKCYSRVGDVYLPYAADITTHHPDDSVAVENDVCLIGLHYDNRNALVRELRALGMKVRYDLGLIFDDYRQAFCSAKVGLNWSSLNDMTARVFEIMAMGRVPVINRVPDLGAVGLIEDMHYYGFSDLREGIEKVKLAIQDTPKNDIMRRTAMEFVWENHTYDHRIDQIFKECGF